MRNLGRLIVQMSTGLVSYGRVVDVISQEREPLTEGTHRPAGDVRGEVVFEDVGFEYEAGTPVLHDISFRFEPGQAVALLGSTGSGKTTLVNLLPRFYEYTQRQPDAGRRRAEGLSPRLPAQPDRHRGAGAVPVLAHHPREHHLRRGPRGARRGGGGRGAGRGHPRRDPDLPGWLQHAGRREGRHPVGRPEAARGHRPHAAEEPAHPDPGRLDLLGGHRDRGRDPRRRWSG